MLAASRGSACSCRASGDSTALERIRTIGIIGAGVAGIVTAKTLLARGFECTVFERNSMLGGVWAAGYSNFGTQVQRELYEFPDWPLAPEIPDFTPGPIVQQYLKQYAQHFDVWPQIQFDSAVTRVCRRSDGAGWTLAYARNDISVEQNFDFVIICTGLFSNKPHRPTFPGQDRFQGELIHVSELTNRVRLAGKKVSVVGFGKSATDAALESCAVAAETCILFRDVHWPIPPRLLGILPFKWAMLNRLTSTLIPLYYRPSVLERWVHSLGKPLVWGWWRIVEGLLIAQYGLGSLGKSRLSLVPHAPIEFDAFGESGMLPRPEFYRSVRTGVIEPIMSEIVEIMPTGVILKNGLRREVDTIILATGWEADYSFLAEDVHAALTFSDDGLYLYRQMLHPDVRNLAFIGYASTITSVLTYNLQARWLADLIAGHHQLPAESDMHGNIEAQQAWKRRGMPFSKSRGARLLLHMLHYHDELLEDMGVSPLRKTGVFGPFKEVFAPYEPCDYRNVVSDGAKSIRKGLMGSG